jgi:TetR/AcrR family transcriptional regulator, transcriptional repressor of aconitase
MNIRPARKPGRPAGDHAQRQRDIADTLLQTIGTHGFERASMRVVAREAGYTTGVLSHYFASKEDLICHAVDLLFDWAEHRAAGPGESDCFTALRRTLGTDESEEPPFDFWGVWLQVLAKAKQNRRFAQIVAKRHGQFRDLLTAIIRGGQKRKQVRTDIPADLLADYVNAVSDGLGLMAPIETRRLSKERIARITEMSIEFLKAK